MVDNDFNAGFPVRSEADGTDQRLQTKIVDKSNPGSQQMTVDTDSNAHVEMHGNDPAGLDRVVRTSELGALTPDGLYHATDNTLPGTVGLTAQTRNATAADSRQAERPTAKRGTVDTTDVSLDMSLHDENGNKYSTSNPLPVVLSNEETGTPVHDFLESPSALAASGGTYTRTYTVATASLTLKRIVMSASGLFKAEIAIGDATTTPRKYVLFNSAADKNIPFEIPKNFLVAVADVVKVTYTNLDKQSMTVYTTIEGTTGA